jgi:hypothetical protein
MAGATSGAGKAAIATRRTPFRSVTCRHIAGPAAVGGFTQPGDGAPGVPGLADRVG